MQHCIAHQQIIILSPIQHKTYTFKDVYKKPYDNGYGESLAHQRFNILKLLNFKSVLDVGSGACFLYKWLMENNLKINYEAVDVRTDALELCKCQTYSEIPKNKKYDLVCLFGTVTYNFAYDNYKNKQIFLSLLRESIKISNNYLLFTVMKNEINTEATIKANRFLYYTKEDVINILADLNISKYQIVEDDNYDKEEYFVICNVKDT